MNDARQLYLATYGRIDTIDAAIKKCRLFYVTWKYWHAAKNHALALALVTAYDIYQELSTEEQARSFFGNSDCFPTLTFHQFRDKLSRQGLQYDPTQQNYLGDERMRVNTKMPK